MKTLIGLAAAAAVLAGAPVASAQVQDTILKSDNTEIKCRVQKASYTSVTYTDSKGVSTTLKASEVADIRFGDEPQAFQSAKNARGNAQPDKAAVRFEEALKEIETKKQRVEFNKAPLFFEWGDFLAERGSVPEALAMLKRIRTECGPDSWWRPQSWRKSVDFAKGQGIEAQKAIYDEWKSDPEPLGSEAEMGLAELAVSRNEHDEALALYQKVGSNTSSPHAETAKVGAFRMLKKLDRKSELDSYSQRLLSDSTTSPALQQAAGAWVATSLLEKAGKDRARIRTAIQAAAKAIAMGPPYGRDDAQDYVSALRVAAKGWALLGADAKPEVKEEYRQRALGYLTEIVRAYKDTPFAESAKLEMQALGASEK